MREDLAIVVENVSKKFGLTLKQSMKYGLRDISRNLSGRQANTSILRQGEFWAVRDVSFNLKPGEALGIMGVNGSGKTTLLRILNGVYAPDTGRIQMRGRVGALIAAGAGFAPMLSGRENVYVNGALLGLSTEEIDSLIDEIIAFSELGNFIDLPVKNYSSGMYVRLGFAIAALSRPNILLMDEVLAVGDLNFQKKCFDYVLELKNQGTAIILVSHSIGAIWSVCDRGIFMDRGYVLVDGPAEDVIRAYDDQNSRNAMSSEKQFEIARQIHSKKDKLSKESSAKKGGSIPNEYGHSKGGTGDAFCTSVRVLDENSRKPIDTIVFGEPLLIEYRYQIKNKIENPIFRSSIDAAHYKFIVSIDSYEQGFKLEHVDPGEYIIYVRVNGQALRPGTYKLNTSITSRTLGVHIFYWLSAVSFVVSHSPDYFLYSNDKAVFFLPSEFTLEEVL